MAYVCAARLIFDFFTRKDWYLCVVANACAPHRSANMLHAHQQMYEHHTGQQTWYVDTKISSSWGCECPAQIHADTCAPPDKFHMPQVAAKPRNLTKPHEARFMTNGTPQPCPPQLFGDLHLRLCQRAHGIDEREGEVLLQPQHH